MKLAPEITEPLYATLFNAQLYCRISAAFYIIFLNKDSDLAKDNEFCGYSRRC